MQMTRPRFDSGTSKDQRLFVTTTLTVSNLHCEDNFNQTDHSFYTKLLDSWVGVTDEDVTVVVEVRCWRMHCVNMCPRMYSSTNVWVDQRQTAAGCFPASRAAVVVDRCSMLHCLRRCFWKRRHMTQATSSLSI